GIRDDLVTGVQTCALPILATTLAVTVLLGIRPVPVGHQSPVDLSQIRKVGEEVTQGHDSMAVGEDGRLVGLIHRLGRRNKVNHRSEERRVGKKGGWRWTRW